MRRALLALLVAISLPAHVQADDVVADPFAGFRQLAWSLIGDRFVWGDIKVRSGWRLQENGLNNRCRVLNGGERTVLEGDCAIALDAFDDLAPVTRTDSSPLVIMVHGLGGARMDFSILRRDLGNRRIAAETVAYPSLLGDISAHARRLNAILNGVKGKQPFLFVTHSMGGLVVRTALAETASWRRQHAVDGLFMIGPPNRGAALARLGTDFVTILGPATLDLIPENARTIPAPDVRYCIIAGATGTADGLNPAVPGDDDGVIGLAETLIQPGDDRLILNANHRALLGHPETAEALRRFIGGGRCAPI